MKLMIKDAAAVFMDGRVWSWPNVPRGHIDTKFEIRDITSGGLWLVAPGFGGSPYGNGAIHVENKDVRIIKQEDADATVTK